MIPIWALIAVAIVGALALWLPVMLVAVLFSGWYELARAFPERPPAQGAVRGVGSIFFSPIFRYSRIVLYAVDDDMLHLRLPAVVGAFHKPVSIPWAAIHLDERSRAGMTPVVILGRRILLSVAMVRHELAVRAAMHELPPLDEGLEAHSEPEVAADPVSGPGAHR